MKGKIVPQQAFLIFSMLFGTTPEEREPTKGQAALKPARLVTELEQLGLITLEKRGRATHLVLRDEAWDWAVENLTSELPKTAKAAKLLQSVLGKLQVFLRDGNHSLAEFVTGAIDSSAPGAPSAAPGSAGVVAEGSTASLEERVRAACLDLARGATRQRVRLADLRRRVGTNREELDHTLLAMQQRGRLVLFKIENPAEITPDDLSAAIDIAGHPRHLVYLEG